MPKKLERSVKSNSKRLQWFANLRRSVREALAEAKARAQAEEDAINAYNEALANRMLVLLPKSRRRRKRRIVSWRRLLRETERKRREEEEFNDLRDMLWAEELEAARARDAQERKDKAYNMRKEMMVANDNMLRAKAEQRIKDAENEPVSWKTDEKEIRRRRGTRARRRCQQEEAKAHHMQLVEEQRAQRRAMYDEEKEGELAAAQEAARREEYRKQVIAEARKRLIEEHANRLKEFMPRV